MDDAKVTYIRGRDLWANDGDYADWHWDDKLQFVTKLNTVLAPRVGLGLSFGTLKHQFVGRQQGRIRIQSPFGFCFEMLFHALLKDEGFNQVVTNPGVDLSFVIEEGNFNNGEIFQRYQRLKIEHGSRLPFFSGMAFADKKSSIAIQMADLYAFLTRRHREAVEKNNRQPVDIHPLLAALRLNIRDIGRASTDFGYSEAPEGAAPAE